MKVVDAGYSFFLEVSESSYLIRMRVIERDERQALLIRVLGKFSS